nr:hypothetical protein [Marinicella sp. W31]MDC2876767.1 hypothetical protein [Marinicella sp. W31]
MFLADVDGSAVAAAADDADDLGWYALEDIRTMNVPTSVLECAEKLG